MVYSPPHYVENRMELLLELIRRYNFANLVTIEGNAPVLTHLPFLLEERGAPHGTLLGHMARANPQWRSFDDKTPVLTVFQGPHAYVSPAWYTPAPDRVPTWNYTVAHVWGVPRIITQPEDAYLAMQRLVRAHETFYQTNWQLDLAEPHRSALLKGITVFEIPIERLEGKFKLHQKDTENKGRVAAELQKIDDQNCRELGILMERANR